MTDSLEKAREIADSFLMDLTARHCESWVGDPMSYSEGKEILSSKIAAALAEAREEGIAEEKSKHCMDVMVPIEKFDELLEITNSDIDVARSSDLEEGGMMVVHLTARRLPCYNVEQISRRKREKR